MPQSKPIVFFVVGITLLLAMALRIMALPHDLAIYNPDWVLLCLIYWNLAIPDRMGVGISWFTGLITDVLTGRMLGQHALAYAVTAYCCIRLHRQLRLYPLYQQALATMLLLLLGQVLVFWLQNFKGSNAISIAYWLPSLTGAALWPAIFVALRSVRRRFNIF